MKKFKARPIQVTLIIVLVIVNSLDLLADSKPLPKNTSLNSTQCANLILKCFQSEDDNNRSDCLYNSANNTFCKGTKPGKIALQRWFISPNQENAPELETAPGFLGPKLVDKQCLKDFDSLFVSALVNSESLPAVIPNLEGKLKECVKTENPNITRP